MRPTPAPPAALQVLGTSTGWLLRPPEDAPAPLLVHGPWPVPYLLTGPLALPRPRQGALRIRLAYGTADGAAPLGPPLVLSWRAPPPPPPPPLAFFDGAAVQISWLPPPANVTAIRVLRDGAPWRTLGPADGTAADPDAPPGAHRYALQHETARTLTDPSAETLVTVPPPPAR